MARLHAGGSLVDLEADLLGAGKRNEANLRVLDDGAADLGAALEQVDDARGHAGVLEDG